MLLGAAEKSIAFAGQAMRFWLNDLVGAYDGAERQEALNRYVQPAFDDLMNYWNVVDAGREVFVGLVSTMTQQGFRGLADVLGIAGDPSSNIVISEGGRAAGLDGDDVILGLGESVVFVSSHGSNVYVDTTGRGRVEYDGALSSVDAHLGRREASYGSDANRFAQADFLLSSGSARDTLSGIDTLVGSAFGDTFTGDMEANFLYGGGGGDILEGAGGNDTIDGGVGIDTAVFSGNHMDYSILQNFLGAIMVRDNRDGSPDGQDILTGIELLRFADQTVTLVPADAIRTDFDGNGYSDILWRHGNGLLTSWGASEGGYAQNAALSLLVSTDWKVADTGDFDGDGMADILWRNDDGTLTVWHSNGTTFDAGGFSLLVGSDWQVAGAGDFDGDGRDDILWRNADGRVTQWLSDGAGFNGAGQPVLTVTNDWQVASLGDFNGDGRDDILWRNDDGRVTQWLGVGSGFNGAGQPTLLVSSDWTIADTGDFNGDGRDDILWRNDDGRVTQWLGVGNGFDGAGQPTLSVGTDWQVARTGDVNGDGYDDILWRNTNGDITQWLGTGTSFNGAGQPTYAVGNDWAVVG